MGLLVGLSILADFFLVNQIVRFILYWVRVLLLRSGIRGFILVACVTLCFREKETQKTCFMKMQSLMGDIPMWRWCYLR